MARMVALLSGGQDSTTALFWALAQGHDVHAVSFEYGQRHWVEIAAAKRVAKKAGVPHEVLHLGPRGMGVSALLSERGGPIEERPGALPTSFVPGRNMLFLTAAAAFGYALDRHTLLVGCSAVDYSGYPDCRPAFLAAAEKALALALDREVQVLAPLLALTKAATVQMAETLGCLDTLRLTWTCYTPVQLGRRGHVKACGVCPACRIRAAGFEKAGIEDPAAGLEQRA